jgi:hypothetical protein
MTPRVAILSGGRAGEVEPLTGTVVSVGRHPTCKIRLDPDHDLDVSNRHAVLQRRDEVWTVRDLGSIQGTYLNGQRISEEQPLNDGDILRLGAGGPEVQFLLSERAQVAEPSREPTVAQAAKPAMSPEELERILEEEKAGQLARDMAAAARRRQLFKLGGAIVAAVALVAVALFLWRRQVERKAAEAARVAELAQADSLIAGAASITVASPVMQASLDSARQAATRFRTALDAAQPLPMATATLMAGLDSAVARERDIGDAAGFDAASVAAPSSPAVGLVVAEFADGSTALATGFAVRRDGTGGVILTTRKVLSTADGAAATRVLVIMPGVAQPIPARVVATHKVEDIALLRVQQRGGVPVVQGLAWREPPVATGRPVALVGYPGPIDIPANNDWRKASPTAETVTGTAARVARDFITVDGWGATLSPGSPLIDAEGLVAGLVSTNEPSESGRLYDAVPVKFALELLDQLQ